MEAAPTLDHPPAEPGLFALFGIFLKIGLFSFGGGLSSWVHQEVVVRHRWMTSEDFLAGLTIAQVLPGANVTNIAVHVGHRLHGMAGAFVAVHALLIGPFLLVIGMAEAFARLSRLPGAIDVLDGVAAAAVGMLLLLGLQAALAGIRSATARAAPGPGSMISTLIGWHVAGWPGVIVATLALFLPTSLLCYLVIRGWRRLSGMAWHGAVTQSLRPIGGGLVLAGVVQIATISSAGFLYCAVAATAALMFHRWPGLWPPAVLSLGGLTFAAARALVHGLH